MASAAAKGHATIWQTAVAAGPNSTKNERNYWRFDAVPDQPPQDVVLLGLMQSPGFRKTVRRK